MSSFEVVSARRPPPLAESTDNPLNSSEINDFVLPREEVMHKMKTKLDRVVQNMKKEEDRRCSNVEFVVGEKVLVKL